MTDGPEFLEFFFKHEAELRAFVGALVRNYSDREDIFQETVLTLWHKYDEYDPNRPFGSWARGIAVKKVLQYRTKSGRSPTPFSPEAIRAIADAFERTATARPQASSALEALEKCIESLPDRSRSIIEYRYQETLSLSQIAVRLASTTTAMTMALSRIRAILQECVKRRLLSRKEAAE